MFSLSEPEKVKYKAPNCSYECIMGGLPFLEVSGTELIDGSEDEPDLTW